MSTAGTRNKRNEAFGPPALTPVGIDKEKVKRIEEGNFLLDSIIDDVTGRNKKKKKKEYKIHHKEEKVKEEKVVICQDEDDDLGDRLPTSEEDFLNDLLWVYRQWGGKRELLEQVKKDPSTRKKFMETLLRMEIKRVEEQGKDKRVKGGGKDRGFFLVLKGFEDTDKEIEKVSAGKVKAGDISHILDNYGESSRIDDDEEYKYDLSEEEIDEGILHTSGPLILERDVN
jgi:hypothetical protein